VCIDSCVFLALNFEICIPTFFFGDEQRRLEKMEVMAAAGLRYTELFGGAITAGIPGGFADVR